MTNKYDEIMERIEFRYMKEHIPINEQDVKTLEAELGFQLPKDYAVFLLKYGIGSGNTVRCRDFKGRPSAGVEVFYGLNPKNSRDLLRKKRALGDRIPENILPIAESPGGEICISLAGDDIGKIYWWDRAEEMDDPYKNLDLIHQDFDSFMNSLTTEEL